MSETGALAHAGWMNGANSRSRIRLRRLVREPGAPEVAIESCARKHCCDALRVPQRFGMKRRILKAVGLFAVALVVGLPTWKFYGERSIERAFQAVQRFESEEVVLKRFNRVPSVRGNWKGGCNWNDGELTNDDQHTTNSPRCVRLLYFYPPFPICGEAAVVGFDEDGRAVSKFHVSSP